MQYWKTESRALWQVCHCCTTEPHLLSVLFIRFKTKTKIPITLSFASTLHQEEKNERETCGSFNSCRKWFNNIKSPFMMDGASESEGRISQPAPMSNKTLESNAWEPLGVKQPDTIMCLCPIESLDLYNLKTALYHRLENLGNKIC